MKQNTKLRALENLNRSSSHFTIHILKNLSKLYEKELIKNSVDMLILCLASNLLNSFKLN